MITMTFICQLISVFFSIAQLQLSEVIMQTRHYMMDMVGGHGMHSIRSSIENIIIII